MQSRRTLLSTTWIGLGSALHLRKTKFQVNNYCSNPVPGFCEIPHFAKLDAIAYGSRLHICNNIREIKELHANVIISGLHLNLFLCAKLVTRCAGLGEIEYARKVFDGMPKKDVVSWTAIISGYCKNGRAEEAAFLLQKMQMNGIIPNSYTVVGLLGLFANLRDLHKGRMLHAYVMRSGDFCFNVYLGTALIDLYVKCGQLEDAQSVFNSMLCRNSLCYNSLIAGYAYSGHMNEALILFHEMQFHQHIQADPVTFTSLIIGSSHGDLQEHPEDCNQVGIGIGQSLHGCVIKKGVEGSAFVGSALIGFYAKYELLEDAEQVFSWVHTTKDVVLWTAMLKAYQCSGHSEQAINLFQKILQQNVKVDFVVIISVLSACAQLRSMQENQVLHSYAIRLGFGQNVLVNTSLIDMYAKCDRVDEACKVFEKMHEKDVASWNAMIAAYGMHGQGKEALALADEMQCRGVQPNHVTYVSIMSACRHADLLDEGLQYMARFGKENYTSMVELGISEQFDLACTLIKQENSLQ